jgi:hypothetical protein
MAHCGGSWRIGDATGNAMRPGSKLANGGALVADRFLLDTSAFITLTDKEGGFGTLKGVVLLEPLPPKTAAGAAPKV